VESTGRRTACHSKNQKGPAKGHGSVLLGQQGIIMVIITDNYYADLIHKLAREADHKRPNMRRGIILAISERTKLQLLYTI
jgi:hypothetical protein